MSEGALSDILRKDMKRGGKLHLSDPLRSSPGQGQAPGGESHEERKRQEAGMEAEVEGSGPVAQLPDFFTILGALLYRNIQSLEEEQLGHSARNLAAATARFLEEDQERYGRISQALPGKLPPDVQEDLEALQEIFRELKAETDATYLYTLKKTPEGAIYILDGEAPESPGYSPPGTLEILGGEEKEAFAEGIPVISPLKVDPVWGNLLSAFAPIHGEQGEVLGLVGADYSAAYLSSLLASIRLKLGVMVALLGLFSFLLLRHHRQSREEALHLDFLTGIHSRRYHEKKLRELSRKAGKKGLPLCLLVIDVDHFKKINDTKGHSIGDFVLSTVARRLARYTREGDICSRIGGDEFAVLLPDTTLEQGQAVAAKVLERLYGGAQGTEDQTLQVLGVTLSIGVAELVPGMSPEDLALLGDQALYQAKTNGRNQVAALKWKGEPQ